MATDPSSTATHHYVDIRPDLNDFGNTPPLNPRRELLNNTTATFTEIGESRNGRGDGGRTAGGGGGWKKNMPRNWPFGRFASLETGGAKKGDEDCGNKADVKILRRRVQSMGAFSTATSTSAGDPRARKGDFRIFRTKSTFKKQNTILPQRQESEHRPNVAEEPSGGESETINASVPAGRYFAALRGPELDEIKETEGILVTTDELWPFLLRFPIGCFGIVLGLGSQAILWGNLASSPAMKFLNVSPDINIVLWFLALAVFASVFVTYSLKCIYYFGAIRREYYHPIRINFFFAPWICCMFLAIAVPPHFAPKQLHPAVWCTFITPIFGLELKIYGQWLSGGKRRMCMVVNPSSHLAVVGNFVGAILAAKVGWEEAGKFFWAVGLAHYLVVFVTLYQRLPTSEALPRDLQPVYCMFIATPAAASIAWGAVYGSFDGVSRTFFFIALFLYISLLVRIKMFAGIKFSIAWWAYTFPITTASVAGIKYAEEVPHFFSKGLATSLALMSAAMVLLLFVYTLLHAFVWCTLFPNDLAIAITKKKVSIKEVAMRLTMDQRKAARKSLDIQATLAKSGICGEGRREQSS